MTTKLSPNLDLSHVLLLTQSVMYCAEPTSAICEMEPSAMMVPVPNLLCPIASASACITSCRLPSSTRTTLMHSLESVDGTQAGKDWSAATMTICLPPLPTSAPCPPDTHVLQSFFTVLKE